MKRNGGYCIKCRKFYPWPIISAKREYCSDFCEQKFSNDLNSSQIRDEVYFDDGQVSSQAQNEPAEER